MSLLLEFNPCAKLRIIFVNSKSFFELTQLL